MQTVLKLLPLAALAFAQVQDEQVPLELKKQTPASSDGTFRSEPLTLDAIPLLGFGTWNLKVNTSEAVSWAIQQGYRHIDCAAAYGNEEDVGRGIADGLAETGLSREDL